MTNHVHITTPLSAAVAEIVAEFDVPLPQGDARIIEAARRLPALRARFSDLYNRFDIDCKTEEEEIEPHRTPLDDLFCDALTHTIPESPEATEVMLAFDIIEEPGISTAALVAILKRMEARGGPGRALYDLINFTDNKWDNIT